MWTPHSSRKSCWSTVLVFLCPVDPDLHVHSCGSPSPETVERVETCVQAEGIQKYRQGPGQHGYGGYDEAIVLAVGDEGLVWGGGDKVRR